MATARKVLAGKGRALLLALLLLPLLPPGTAHPAFFRRPPRLDVELRFTPTDEVASGVLRSSPESLLSPVGSIRMTDARGGDLLRIGENREEEPFVPVRATGPVATFAERVVRELWVRWGGTLGGGGMTLSGEILDFHVEETRLYRGSVRIRFHLAGKGGRPLWEGTVSAERERFGRSLKADNYREVLSDSLQGALLALVEDRDFQAALAGRGPVFPPPATAPAPPAPPAPASSGPRDVPPPSSPSSAEPRGVEERAVLSPGELKGKLLLLSKEGFDESALAAYVREVRLSAPLTADEMVEWKRAGIPQRVVEAALKAYAP